jgi:hypothetical protein
LGFLLEDNKGLPIVIAEEQISATTVSTNSSVIRNWPLAGLVAAMVVNLAWMGFLGYGFFKLVGPAWF